MGTKRKEKIIIEGSEREGKEKKLFHTDLQKKKKKYQ